MSERKHAGLLHGLYVIADSSLEHLADKVEQALQGGVELVQIRDKRPQPDVMEIKAIAELCRQHQVPLLINDDIALALEVGANGVHLGQSDTSLIEARQRLGENAIIGITCHDQLELAKQAEAGGADYVAFGRFFPSQSKPAAPPASIEVLQQAKQQLHRPIVAIGGITPDNGASLIQAGADMLAVIQGVFGQNDITAAAKKFNQLFEKQDQNL